MTAAVALTAAVKIAAVVTAAAAATVVVTDAAGSVAVVVTVVVVTAAVIVTSKGSIALATAVSSSRKRVRIGVNAQSLEHLIDPLDGAETCLYLVDELALIGGRMRAARDLRSAPQPRDAFPTHDQTCARTLPDPYRSLQTPP